ncbi:MAG: nucleotide exchange factor GrpE [Leptolyngbyaceae cyanobacterium]
MQNSDVRSHLFRFGSWYLFGILIGTFAILLAFEKTFTGISKDTRVWISSITLIIACIFFVAPTMLEAVMKLVEELRKFSREYYKNTATVQESSAAVEQLYSSLEDSNGQLLKLQRSLDEILIQQRQENGNFKREIEHWLNASISFFKLLERALIYEKNPENLAIIEKLTVEFSRIVSSRGLERIIPSTNELFDERFHEAIKESESSDIEAGNILQCESWGYRWGSNIIKRSEVIIVKSSH